MLVLFQRRNLANRNQHRAIPYVVLNDLQNSVMLLNTWRLAVHLSPQHAGALGLRGSEKQKLASGVY
jgi:hypothetical protein